MEEIKVVINKMESTFNKLNFNTYINEYIHKDFPNIKFKSKLIYKGKKLNKNSVYELMVMVIYNNQKINIFDREIEFSLDDKNRLVADYIIKTDINNMILEVLKVTGTSFNLTKVINFYISKIGLNTCILNKCTSYSNYLHIYQNDDDIIKIYKDYYHYFNKRTRRVFRGTIYSYSRWPYEVVNYLPIII